MRIKGGLFVVDYSYFDICIIWFFRLVIFKNREWFFKMFFIGFLVVFLV